MVKVHWYAEQESFPDAGVVKGLTLGPTRQSSPAYSPVIGTPPIAPVTLKT